MLKRIDRDTQFRKSDEQQSASANSDLPTILCTELPSQFLCYPEDSEISYTPYTYGEMMKFSQSKLSKKERIQFLLKGINTSFPKEDLLYFDFLFLSTLRKLKTIPTPELKITYRCTNCYVDNNFTFKVEGIEFHDLDVPALPIIIDDARNGELHFQPLTIGEYLELVRLNKDENQISTAAISIKNKALPLAEIIISEASGELLELLKEVDKLLYFGVKEVDQICPSCDTENHVKVGGDGVLIEPFRDEQAPVRNKIRFGIQRDSGHSGDQPA